MKTQRGNRDELFTTEEMKQLNQLPDEERDKILQKSGRKMIKYWDGYRYKYSPTRVSSPQKPVPKVEFELEAVQPEIIHFSKPNGYRHAWPDATRGKGVKINL